MSDAQVRLDVPGGRASVHASGEFDVATAPVLREALQQACGSALDVELDLSGVTFMDACGLREIARARNTLRNAGCCLNVVHTSAPVRRVFELTGMSVLIPA